MILANYTQENRNTARFIGMAFTNPRAQFREPMIASFYTPDTALPGLDRSAFNNGYNTSYAWHLAPTAGGIGSTRQIIGSGAISASALAVKLAQAAVTGSGTLTATGGLIVSLIAAITGSGTITAANLQAFLAAVAALTGSGSVTATRSALGTLLAALTGSGAISLTPTAVGELSGDLVVTGTGLTTANVGAAVWAQVIEAGFTAEQVLRLIAAVTAGDAAGLESGSPSFTGIDGATERVAGTYSAGTRTISTREGE